MSEILLDFIIFFRNKHGELVGSDVSILRHICKTMNKKCETVVTDTFGPCWDGDNNGLGMLW